MTDFTEFPNICRKIILESEKSEYKKRFLCGKSLYEWAIIWFNTDNDEFFDLYGFNFNPHEYEDLFEIARRDVYPEEYRELPLDMVNMVKVTYSVKRTDFESCDDCVHSGDSVEICKMRLCYHAIACIHDCYERKEEKNGTEKDACGAD
jgi:hypothetical protein